MRSAATAAARRSVTIGGGGVSKMLAARRRTALVSWCETWLICRALVGFELQIQKYAESKPARPRARMSF